MWEGNTKLSNLVFIRKKNGSANDSVDKIHKDKGLRDRSSLSSRIMEQVPLVLVVLCKDGDFDLLLFSPWLAPAEITELAFDFPGIFWATDRPVAALLTTLSFSGWLRLDKQYFPLMLLCYFSL